MSEHKLDIHRRVKMNLWEIEKLAALLKGTTDPDLTFVASALAEIIKEESDPYHVKMTNAYRSGVAQKDGEIEIDADAEVSFGEDDGAYVMAWVWVTDEEAGIESPDEDEDDDE